MAINKILNTTTNDSARWFFGIDNKDAFRLHGFENLLKFKRTMLQMLGIADLDSVNTNEISILLSEKQIRLKNLEKFKEKKLAILTLNGDAFKSPLFPTYMNSHTISLVINENQNGYFFKTNPEIIIMDSLGCNYPQSKEIHGALINDFILKVFPDAKVTINTTPQQTINELTCLNWAFKNSEIAKKNLGRADLINLLPKSHEIDSILEEQKKVLTYYYL